MTAPRNLLLAAPLLALALLAGCRRAGFPDYPDGYREFAYVANLAGNSVTVLDLVYLRPDRTLQVGNSPVALAVSPTRPEVYVVNSQPTQSSGSVSVIATDTNTISATIEVQRNPQSISVDTTGQRAFVANFGSSTISVLDLASHRQIAVEATAEHPNSALISHDGRTLLVTSPSTGTITLYSPAIPPLSNAATSTTKVGFGPPLTLRSTIPGCPGATASVILPDSSKAFIACSTRNQVMAVSLAAAPDSWAAKQDSGLLTDHVLALLDVGVNPTFLALKPDGGEIFVSNSGSDSISEISTQTNEVGSTYAIGNHPTRGIVSGDNGALWVSNSGADSISLYSIDDGKFLSSLHTGSSPAALAFSADEHLLLAADTRSGDVALIRTTGSKFGPALLTILPAGGAPSAIVTRASQAKP